MVKHKILPIMQLFPGGLGESLARPPKGMTVISIKFLESGLTLTFFGVSRGLVIT